MNKWIKFNLYGMIFRMRIWGYGDENEWLKTSYYFQFKDIIKYKNNYVEIFTKECLDLLIDYIGKHLQNYFNEIETLTFYEPDFSFVFIPRSYEPVDDTDIYCKETIMIDISMELHVYLWNKGLTDNYFSMTFERKDIQKLYEYLISVRSGGEYEQKR